MVKKCRINRYILTALAKRMQRSEYSSTTITLLGFGRSTLAEDLMGGMGGASD